MSKTSSKIKTEIIVVSSGKGGTGKTLIIACLGYALIRAGHKVLMIDGDPATGGLSLFLLGRDGLDEISDFSDASTFTGILDKSSKKSPPVKGIPYKPQKINRLSDHEVEYDVIISGKGVYGDIHHGKIDQRVPELTAASFKWTVEALFSRLRKDAVYDYVLVDTRGGFSIKSTYLCALADSFIVVTEADYTSFYQDINLMKWINQHASKVKSKPVLRTIIVNKAVHGDEKSFRLELVKEFPLSFTDTFAIPLEWEVLSVYREQHVPYLQLPESQFAWATLRAFSHTMRLVTGGWKQDRIKKWNELIDNISWAHKKKHGFRARLSRVRRKYVTPVFAITVLVFAIAIQPLIDPSFAWLRDNLARLATVGPVEPALPTSRAELLDRYKRGERFFMSIDMTDWNLNGADLRRIVLYRAILIRTSFVDANLEGADLEGASLVDANLSFSSFIGANLVGANLSGAVTLGTDFRGADLTGATYEDLQLDQWIIDRSTILARDPTDKMRK